MTRYVYSREYVEDVLTDAEPPSNLRIIPSDHLGAPLEMVRDNTRFCSEDGAFAILYTSPDFATAFLETVVRDRFIRKNRRTIPLKNIIERVWIRIESNLGARLNLLDLRGDGCVRLGVPTDAVNARNHVADRALARAIHFGHEDVDGLLFSSRLTGEDVYAVFDRGIEREKLKNTSCG